MKAIVLSLILLSACSLQAQVENQFTEVSEARKWFEQGVQALFEENGLEHQLECYTKAINADPQFKDAYRYRAAVNFKLEKFEDCAADCGKYLEIAHKEESQSSYIIAKVLFRRAEANTMLENYAAAKVDYKAAIENMPREEKYREGLSRVEGLMK